MSFLGNLGKGIAKSLDQLSGIVTNPITAITKGISAAEKEYTSASKTTNVVKTLTNVGLAAGAVVGAGAVAGAARAGTLAPTLANAAKAVIPSTAKGKIIAGTGTLLIGGALINKPAETGRAILNAPSSIANVGANIAEFASNPTLENAKEIFTENPITAGVLTGGAVLAAGAGTLGLISSYRNTAALNDLSDQLSAGNSGEIMLSGTPAAAGIPVTPQTQTVAAGSSSKKRNKARRKQKTPSINQRVNVIVTNRATSTGIRANKKYINREVLLN